MSRSLGSRSVTTAPSMRMSPEVGSSRPAIMRRIVLLPQPLGPTSTTNSCSATSRSTPGTTSTGPKHLRSLRKDNVANRLSSAADQLSAIGRSLADWRGWRQSCISVSFVVAHRSVGPIHSSRPRSSGRLSRRFAVAGGSDRPSHDQSILVEMPGDGGNEVRSRRPDQTVCRICLRPHRRRQLLAPIRIARQHALAGAQIVVGGAQAVGSYRRLRRRGRRRGASCAAG